MKKYEYKYVKKEPGNYNNLGSLINYDDDEAMLTGYGLVGWRVHSLVGTFWLLERELNEKDQNA